MGWSIGYDPRWKRDIGYGVPAFCDQPGCDEEIDRGLGFKCDDEECGCGKFYCEAHLYDTRPHTHAAPPKREHPSWAEHVLTDESWARWRAENPEGVAYMGTQRGGRADG
ncbi:hypothetical protein CO641_02320 [Lysobacteraceae bacterium NML91-0213]|nr:hypothetical protein CO641_02320 [Xanthomonadaceae bacterium NML91-0213]